MILPEVRIRGCGFTRSSFFGGSTFFVAGGEGFFSDAVTFADRDGFSCLDGFANADIFLTAGRGFSDFFAFSDGSSSDRVTFFAAGLLDAVAAGFGGGVFFSGGACAADFCGGGVTFPELTRVSLAD
jgi:hypothetical protein